MDVDSSHRARALEQLQCRRADSVSASTLEELDQQLIFSPHSTSPPIGIHLDHRKVRTEQKVVHKKRVQEIRNILKLHKVITVESTQGCLLVYHTQTDTGRSKRRVVSLRVSQIQDAVSDRELVSQLS